MLIKSFEVTDPHRVGKIEVELHGRIKDCKALTYRQDLRAKEIEQYRVRMLPTRQVFVYLLIHMSLSLFFFGEPHLLAATCLVTLSPPVTVLSSSTTISVKKI